MENISFEQATEQLNEIITQLEEGNISMTKASQLFERGVLLLQMCYSKLDTVKGKFSEVKEKLDKLEEV